MAVRRESVELSLQDRDFTTGMARAAVVTAVLRHELETLDGAGTRANRSTTALGSPNGGIARTGQQARTASNDLNKYTGRLNLLATAATTLGPALIPIGATAIPAVAGLTAGLGAAVGAVGTAVLAFHGLGDALKALDAYQLEPTAANLQKMHDTLGQLSPAAQELVHRLDSLEAPLKNLQTVAQNGMFPGLNEGLDSMMALLPDVEVIVQRISKEMGSLAAGAGASLANDADWQAFFTYVKQDAAPTLDAFARSTGNVIAGLGSLMVAFRPLSDDFASGMLDMSRSFREWAASLSGTSGFQDFVGYIRENGPAVRDFFEALSQAMVGLVKAAAPWGATMLPILTDVAKVFAAIADSPLGPVLYDTAAAMLVLNRATAILGSQSVTRLASGFTGLSTQLRRMPADLRTMSAEYQNLNRFQSASLSLMSGTTGAANRVRGSLAGLGEAAKVAAGVGGFMLLADGMQRTGQAAKVLETAAGGAAIGFGVGGPWGAAIGTATGLVIGFANGNDKAAEASSGLAATLDQQTGALTKMSAAWVASQFNDSQLQAFAKYGVQIGDVTNAILQGGQALDDFKTKRLGAIFDEVDGDKQLYDAYKQIDSISGQVTATQRQYAAQTDATTAAQGKFGDSSAVAAEKASRLSAVVRQQRQDARTAAQQWTAFGNSLDDTKVSLDGWIADMAKQNRALAQFADNAQTAANRGLRDGLIKQLEAAGPAGALRMQQLADGTKAQIGKANAAFALGRRAIQQYVDMKVPEKKPQVDITQAIHSINTLQGRIDAMHGKTVSISTNYTATYTNGPGLTPDIRHKATGGYIAGPGTSTSDSIPARLSNGEFVVNAATTARLRPFLEYENAKGYATGGIVGNAKGGPFIAQNTGDHAIDRSLDKLTVILGKHMPAAAEKAIKAIERSAKAQSHQNSIAAKVTAAQADRDKTAASTAKDHRDAVVADMASIKQSIAARYQSDVFGKVDSSSIAYQIDPKTGKYVDAKQSSVLQLGGITAGLQKDIADAQAAKSAEASIAAALKKQGLGKDKIDAYTLYMEQNASVGQMQALASNPAIAAQQAQLYTQRQVISNATGAAIANQVDGKALQIAQQQYDLARRREVISDQRAKQAAQHQKQFDQRMTHIETSLDSLATKIGREINTASKKGK